ncbi:hypothetical protein [Nostoc favosum]|uniref:hypothetical protein n=1 Tax=Nostoc favosum TaxID=2907819 RepID=UPI0022778BF4|nr:hypothetical protein [Nostoc favosum]
MLAAVRHRPVQFQARKLELEEGAIACSMQMTYGCTKDRMMPTSEPKSSTILPKELMTKPIIRFSAA